MANIITSASVAQAAAFVKSSEQSYYPATNLADWAHPGRPWRATDAVNNTTYVGYNFGVATSLASVVVHNVNMATVTVQHSTNGAAWTTDVGVGLLQDGLDGYYKAYVSLTAWNYQYLRVLAGTNTLTDNSATMMVGGVIPLTSVTTWNNNPGFPYDMTPLRATLGDAEFASGGREPIAVGNRYAQVGLSQAFLPLSDKATLQQVLGVYGTQQPFIYYRNAGDTSEVYIVRRVGAARWAQVGANAFDLSSFVLESAP
jgi:hypothetical protein